MDDELAPLFDHLAALSGLDRRQSRRLVEEVLAYFDAPLEQFVAQRHATLQAQGLKNEAIYAQLAEEISARRFPAPDLTPRQIRRLIYG